MKKIIAFFRRLFGMKKSNAYQNHKPIGGELL